jgi:hypothetical protein
LYIRFIDLRHPFPAIQAIIGQVVYGSPRSNYRGPISKLAAVRLFLPIALLPFVGGLLMCLVALIVDPYDVRPWGMAPRNTEGVYPQDETPNLIRAFSSERHEAIMFGGSTSMPFSSRLVADTLGYQRVANLSYSLPTARDTGPVLLQLVGTPGLRRLLIDVDHSQMRNDGATFVTGRTALSVLDARWFDMPDFKMSTVQASIHRIIDGTYDSPEWRSLRFNSADTQSLIDKPDLLATLDDAVSRPAPGIFTAPRTLPPCDSFAFIRNVLLPVGREAQAQGVTVDIFFPPMPYQTYWNWQKNDVFFGSWEIGARYLQLVYFHQCIFRAVVAAKLSAVRVNATDLDTAIAGHLENYRDTVHLTRNDAMVRLLRDIDSGRFRLTTDNVDRYPGEMSARVRSVAGWRAPRRG